MGDVHSLRSWDSDELPEFLGGSEQTNKLYIMKLLTLILLAALLTGCSSVKESIIVSGATYEHADQ